MSANSPDKPAVSIGDLPMVDEPSDRERTTARLVLGHEAVPEEGPVPHVSTEIDVPVELPERVVNAIALWVEQTHNGVEAADDIAHTAVSLDIHFHDEDGTPLAEAVAELLDA